MKHAHRSSLFLILALLGPGLWTERPAAAQRHYTITDLGTLPGKAVSVAQLSAGINNEGQVVGFSAVTSTPRTRTPSCGTGAS